MPVIYEPKGKAREYAALAANLYAGCEHGCIYCYAPAATFKTSEIFHNARPRNKILQELRRDAATIEKGKSVLFSFVTDPYQPIDIEYELTRHGIEILHDSGLFVEILTKGGSRAIRDFDLLTCKDSFAATLTFTSDEDSLKYEPYAALPMDRINTIKIAKEKGITTWVSLEPVIDPKQSLELINLTHEFVDLFKVGKWNHNKEANLINWHRFGNEAIELLTKYNKQFIIKEDLKKFL